MATIHVDNNARIERLLTSNPDMERKIRAAIRKVMTDAQGITQQYALRLSTREAYRAVRKAVYKKVFGGNLNIITSNRRAGTRAPLPPVYHALEHRTNSAGNHRGGNRTPRSRRTEDLLTYAGADRGFVLRFLENGTDTRTSRYGNRGVIPANRWFSNASGNAIRRALTELDTLLDRVIAEQFNTN